MNGVQETVILAEDRPEEVVELVGNGARWGLKIDLVPQKIELTPAQAALSFGNDNTPILLDHFPGMPEKPLFTSYPDWFSGLLAWMPRALTPDRVGVREIAPRVWVGLHARVSKRAQLLGPCWIGNSVFIGDSAVVGPNAIIEDRSCIDPAAEIVGSCVGADTFMGSGARLANSLAWGRTILALASGTGIEVPDAFLLCSLRRARHAEPVGSPEPTPDALVQAAAEEEWLWKHLLIDKESQG
jgi:carbonic anhydrase/acetyltransferase-like protein (isoleucine patch superfamily)